MIVASPQQVEFQPYAEFLGRMMAKDEVDVYPEVTGVLKKVGFGEGSKVKRGDLLYEIDPELFQATLNKAKADIGVYEAQRKNAEAEIDRLKGVSGSEREKAGYETSRRVAAAQILAAEAAVAQAQFSLTRTKIVAPIGGGINKTEKTEGNLVTANTTKLTKIVSIDPIYADFDVDEATSLKYRDLIYKDKTVGDPRAPDSPLKCWIRLKNEDKWTREGTVNYIARDLNRATASREIRATFDNPNGYMTPGDSCRVRVEVGPKATVLVVPEIAVGSQQTDKIVYVVGADGKVLPRVVQLGEAREGMQVIRKGLEPTDRVVVNGLLRVRPGIEVKAVAEPFEVPAGFR